MYNTGWNNEINLLNEHLKAFMLQTEHMDSYLLTYVHMDVVRSSSEYVLGWI